MGIAIVAGSFDNLRSRHVRFLEEAAKCGPLHVVAWTDAAVQHMSGSPPKFSQEERRYLLEAIRYVDRVSLSDGPADGLNLPEDVAQPGTTWVVEPADDNPAQRDWCAARQMQFVVVPEDAMTIFPATVPGVMPPSAGRKKVLVTGCYDWFHSGHVRFFEEVSALGDLYVVVGHDDNIRLLKGEGHPMFPDRERRYVVASMRHVTGAFISTGHGWLDAEPEIERIKPDIYAVNEDGDHPDKRNFCAAHGIEYRVLERVPKEGLPKRESTDLRGF